MATALHVQDTAPVKAPKPSLKLPAFELQKILANRTPVRTLLSPVVFENDSAAVRLSTMDATLQAIKVTPYKSMLRVTGSLSRWYDELDGVIHYADGRPQRFDFYMTGLTDPEHNTHNPLSQKPMYAIGTARVKDGRLVGTYRPHHALRQIALADVDRFARALYVVSSQPIPNDENGNPKKGSVDIEFAVTRELLTPKHSKNILYFTPK